MVAMVGVMNAKQPANNHGRYDARHGRSGGAHANAVTCPSRHKTVCPVWVSGLI
eukprot:m.186394 g.186394  ORF g.186394 m.186394 type:complete len:54 (+) comp16752_c0_seq1:175-336(+)